MDDVIAGISLGLLGFSPWLAPPLFGAITALMTFMPADTSLDARSRWCYVERPPT